MDVELEITFYLPLATTPVLRDFTIPVCFPLTDTFLYRMAIEIQIHLIPKNVRNHFSLRVIWQAQAATSHKRK